jgi:hypothetical protein
MIEVKKRFDLGSGEDALAVETSLEELDNGSRIPEGIGVKIHEVDQREGFP